MVAMLITIVVVVVRVAAAVAVAVAVVAVVAAAVAVAGVVALVATAVVVVAVAAAVAVAVAAAQAALNQWLCCYGGLQRAANSAHQMQGICVPEIPSQRKSTRHGQGAHVKAHAGAGRPTMC